MKATMLFVALLALPTFCLAKTQTARIEIARGKVAMITLTGPEEAGQFTIWSGPGTSMKPGDDAPITPTGERDFADWAGGPVKPPRLRDVYSVRFYCAAAGETARESVPSHFCYGVRYACDRSGKRGYIQIPPADDPEFPRSTQAIYRGVEGRWFRASERWEEAVRAELEAARAAQPEVETATYYQQQPYIQPPSHSAVSATPKVTPKTR